LRSELQRLNQRLEELRRDQSEKRTGPDADLSGLRSDLQRVNQRLEELRRDQSEKRAIPGADVSVLRAELQPLSQRLDELRRDQSEKRAAPDADLAALRSELSGMSSALADLAPRNAVIAIEGAVRDLSDRIAALRDQNLRESLGRPVDEIIAGIRETLHANDPRKAVVSLEREIGAIRDRLDALARTRVDPDVLERIRQQTEEVRGMLSAAAQRPMPVDRLERQIGELADRVDHLASSRSPHIESAQVVASLANARAEIERSTPALALNVIERRLEDIASKIDQAIVRSQSTSSIGAKAVEELARRIDSVRETIETRHPLPIVSASLEATMRDLTAKLQDAQAPRFDTEPLEVWMREVSEKLDSARPVSFDTGRFESTMRELAAKLKDSQAPSFDKAPLEAWMREVSEKLERAGAAGLNTRQLEGWMREVSEKLETARPIALDTKPLEGWMRELTAKLDSVKPSGIDTKPLEDTLRSIDIKLSQAAAPRFESALVDQTAQALAREIEARIKPSADIRAIEGLLRN
ncbi:MAG TPA: hypothetical protein VGI70_04680, partial [Polyangiales bacterium]